MRLEGGGRIALYIPFSQLDQSDNDQVDLQSSTHILTVVR